MTSKQSILSTIRKQNLHAKELPSLDLDWLVYSDPRQQFTDVLTSVGGQCIVVPDLATVNQVLAGMSQYAAAKKICSAVPGAGASNVDLNELNDPHQLEDIDFAIMPGEFAVAENGAVWINDQHSPQRAVYFIAQHLALIVPAAAIVSNMHQAYERLAIMPTGGAARNFTQPGFGVFISGPSKTADIEQSLVIGAHGPRSHVVFLLESAEIS